MQRFSPANSIWGPRPNTGPKTRASISIRGGHAAGSPSAHGGGGFFSPYKNPRLEDGPKGEYLPYRLADETGRFIEDHKDKPFFAYLSFYEVHNPKQAPKDLVEKYKKKRERLGLDEEDEFGQIEQVWPGAGKHRRERIGQGLLVYAAMVEATDRAIGQVLDKLEETGVSDNTNVVFTSDHGGLSTSEGHNTSNVAT